MQNAHSYIHTVHSSKHIQKMSLRLHSSTGNTQLCNMRLFSVADFWLADHVKGYCLMRESTSASSGPSWFSPPSSSSTNLFSSYSSTSTRLKRADTVFFDISLLYSDRKRQKFKLKPGLFFSRYSAFFLPLGTAAVCLSAGWQLPDFLPFPLCGFGFRVHFIAAWWLKYEMSVLHI